MLTFYRCKLSTNVERVALTLGHKPHLFHKILVDYQKPGTDHKNLVDWIAWMDRRPRV